MTPEPAAPSSVSVIQRLLARISGLGLLMGALLMAASLTPSLIPRSDVIQGLLGGVCFAAGYGIAVILRAIWSYLQLPAPEPIDRDQRHGARRHADPQGRAESSTHARSPA